MYAETKAASDHLVRAFIENSQAPAVIARCSNIHVRDHVDAIWMVLTRGRDGEVYNIGGETQETNLAVVRLLLRMLDKPEHLIRHVPDRPGHDRRYAMDITKMRHQLGWRPKYSLETGLLANGEVVPVQSKLVGAFVAGSMSFVVSLETMSPS